MQGRAGMRGALSTVLLVQLVAACSGGHGGDTHEERTIFFLVSGVQVRVGAPDTAPGVVDVAVTALVHLGIEIDPVWGLDGQAVGIGR